MRASGFLWATLSALLFGLSAPLAKVLVEQSGSIALASLLYLGAGIGLTFARLFRKGERQEAPLRRDDLPKLVAMVLTGGVAAPILLLWGLSRVSGVVGSLLLNLEQLFTIGIAVVLFKDHLGKAGMIAAGLLVLGAGMVAWQPGMMRADPWGVLAIAAACLCWGVDNNVTERLSLRDPLALTQLKSLAGGAINACLAFALQDSWPPVRPAFLALGLGALSYGCSLVMAILAIRQMGAARQSAIFALAPFAGALASLVLFRESLGGNELGGGIAMTLGVVVFAFAHHGHRHTHARLVHEHSHMHDLHHSHVHEGDVSEPHSHPHEHAPVEHDHEHLPDAHHRHRH
jgi:drug/metabolite transporter (DMT)-like permease